VSRLQLSGNHIQEHVSLVAHCIYEKGTVEPFEAAQVEVQLGKFDLTNDNEESTLRCDLSEIRIHPDWKSERDATFDADISLLTMVKEIEFSDAISPVCLPFPRTDKVVTGEGVIVSLLL